jgi:transcription elongation factor GreA
MVEEIKFYLTKKGLEKIKKEYEALKRLKASKIKGESPQLLHSEDINPEYLTFREDMSFLEAKISELENVLKNVELIQIPPKENQNIVNLGATVTLEEKDGQINEFMIVGTLEANPNQGKISAQSPVGKAILGHKIGDEIMITSPIKVIYKLKKIKYHSA